MIDEQQQHPQQLELAGVAVTCFWLLLRHAAAQSYSWPIRRGREAHARLCWFLHAFVVWFTPL